MHTVLHSTRYPISTASMRCYLFYLPVTLYTLRWGLFRAIEYRQFNLVKFVGSQNAKCQESTQVGLFKFDETPPPILLLASQQSVPSDLFDMLATPHDLTWALFAAT